MNFVDAVKKCFAKFADFNGRAGLSEFWWFILFSFLCGLVLGFVSSTLANIVGLIFFVPQIAVTARRLHDIDKTGWTQLWWTIGIVVGIGLLIFGFASMFISGGVNGGGSALIGGVGGLIAIASVGFAIYLLIKSGDAGENQYGPVPEESTSLTA